MAEPVPESCVNLERAVLLSTGVLRVTELSAKSRMTPFRSFHMDRVPVAGERIQLTSQKGGLYFGFDPFLTYASLLPLTSWETRSLRLCRVREDSNAWA